MGASVILIGVQNGFTWHDFIDVGAILAFCFSIVGALVAARKPFNVMGWIYLGIAFSQGLSSFAYQYSHFTYITSPGSLPFGAIMSVLGETAWLPGFCLMTTYALQLFPTGKPVSPAWRVLAWASVLPFSLFLIPLMSARSIGGLALVEDPAQLDAALGLPPIVVNLGFPYMLLLGAASVVSLFVRLRRAGGVERQQIKVFAYAAAVTFVAIFVSNYLSEYVPNDFLPVLNLIFVPFLPLIPIAAAIAILRYRLWDIDLVIRRTLVYGVLTLSLGLIYFGSVVVMQSLVTAAGGSRSAFVTVISTLIIAALFTPLRQRIQSVIDRRFSRKKYNAEKIVAAFGASLRDQVDLEELCQNLLYVVDSAMQPERMGLWLRYNRK